MADMQDVVGNGLTHKESAKGTDAVLGDPFDGRTGGHSSSCAGADVESMDEAAGGQGSAHPACDVGWQASELVLQIVIGDCLGVALGEHEACHTKQHNSDPTGP